MKISNSKSTNWKLQVLSSSASLAVFIHHCGLSFPKPLRKQQQALSLRGGCWMELAAWPCHGTRSSSRVRGALGRTASTALLLPSSCQL